MARVLSLSRALNRIPASPLPNPTSTLYTKLSSSSPRILTHRNGSNQSGKAQLVEIDLDSESSSSGGGEVEVMGVRKLEEVIHNIIVRRSAPDWLPFIPGSSYWVPPRGRPSGAVELVGKFKKPFSEEENMSFSSVRGWPSSVYFIQDSTPAHPMPVAVQVEVEVQVKVQESTVDVSQSEDEEG